MFDLKIIAGLVLALSLTVYGGWKYHVYMNEKVTELTVKLENQKAENAEIAAQLSTFTTDFEQMRSSIETFQADVTRIQRENSDLRRRISSLTSPNAAGANRDEAQESFDRLRREMTESWENIR